LTLRLLLPAATEPRSLVWTERAVVKLTALTASSWGLIGEDREYNSYFSGMFWKNCPRWTGIGIQAGPAHDLADQRHVGLDPILCSFEQHGVV
jgi:hypothetical protein